MLRFHGNHFHNTAAFEGACVCRVRISDKVATAQKKAKGGYRKKEERGKEKGVVEGDKRMSDLG